MKYKVIYSLANDELVKTLNRTYEYKLPEQKNRRCAIIAALDYMSNIVDINRLIWPQNVILESRTETKGRLQWSVDLTKAVKETAYGGLVFFTYDLEMEVQIRVTKDGCHNVLEFKDCLGYSRPQLVDLQTFETYKEAEAYVSEIVNDYNKRDEKEY